jgi:hypothetical protein
MQIAWTQWKNETIPRRRSVFPRSDDNCPVPNGVGLLLTRSERNEKINLGEAHMAVRRSAAVLTHAPQLSCSHFELSFSKAWR